VLFVDLLRFGPILWKLKHVSTFRLKISVELLAANIFFAFFTFDFSRVKDEDEFFTFHLTSAKLIVYHSRKSWQLPL
jgi:hypothetical protein